MLTAPEQNIITTYDKLQTKISKLVSIRNASNVIANVLIIGETGTGKDLLARIFSAKHDPLHGKLTPVPFVEVNCGAIPISLFESEMFGSVRGAFTGSVGERKGFLEQANGGTLFLDEITDLPLTCQGALLKAIETGCFHKLGSSEIVKSRFRVVSATNNKEALNDSSKFRMDLRYRVSDFEVDVPPLKERPIDDIYKLAQHFTSGKMPIEVVKAIIAKEHYGLNGKEKLTRWPGNVRQLERICRAWLATGEIERRL